MGQGTRLVPVSKSPSHLTLTGTTMTWSSVILCLLIWRCCRKMVEYIDDNALAAAALRVANVAVALAGLTAAHDMVRDAVWVSGRQRGLNVGHGVAKAIA